MYCLIRDKKANSLVSCLEFITEFFGALRTYDVGYLSKSGTRTVLFRADVFTEKEIENLDALTDNLNKDIEELNKLRKGYNEVPQINSGDLEIIPLDKEVIAKMKQSIRNYVNSIVREIIGYKIEKLAELDEMKADFENKSNKEIEKLKAKISAIEEKYIKPIEKLIEE